MFFSCANSFIGDHHRVTLNGLHGHNDFFTTQNQGQEFEYHTREYTLALKVPGVLKNGLLATWLLKYHLLPKCVFKQDTKSYI